MKRSILFNFEGPEKGYLGDCGGLAQLGEHLLCKQEVIGSIPLFSIANREVSELVL